MIQPQESREVAGLLKFFAKQEYLEDFLRGKLYCNTPQHYRDSYSDGVSDDFDACVAYFNPNKRSHLPPIAQIDGKLLDLSEVESLMVFTEDDMHDAHLQCWCALEKCAPTPENLNLLSRDLSRLQQESGGLYVFLPSRNIEAYRQQVESHCSEGFISNFVQYTEDWTRRGMFGKRVRYAYQREYRFAFGRLPKGHVAHRVIEVGDLSELVEVCPPLVPLIQALFFLV
ncbi:hypothetical protein [Iodobacter fluviatilis]|uniref:Uncharacterized protein n=1 Tax=Iodobacter fluviatilis TaxID=537 RepID=A0A7G3GEH1_9NEIS|nr:hypothetical protein [Iodobacter fluviatilis]QBC45075.1 hypothetical protein C1H71_17045 [Iodobacter fluviatilis]